MAENKIDPRSDTWKAVLEWAQAQRDEAIEGLIQDHDSEQQRGRIGALDDLVALAAPDDVPTVVADTYT
ncbi:hypothetical protein M8009_13045 [Halomonas sp. ATCH28]|uniref:Uncharacterized protein n=1 Tax=Halomonas gemina TaxID=2945105 RepID=A0ABT0T359_9GAMM|nr:hypothetical protein [Halomonas gemina]MCL7941213.1 hypothetical protein [Halomonas gemina]